MTITESFAAYCRNITRQRELDNTLFDTADRDAWKERLLQRALELRSINLGNKQSLAALRQSIDDGLTEPEAEELLACGFKAIAEGFSDAALHFPVFMALSEYFKRTGNLKNYIASMYYASFIEEEILFRSGAEETMPTALDETIISLKDHYAEVDDPERRTVFFMAYNALAVCAYSERENFDKSYRTLLDMEAFWNSPAVQALDGDNPLFIEYMQTTRRLWLQLPFEPQDRGTEVCDYFIRSAAEHFRAMEAECGGDVSRYLIQVYGPYLNSLVIKGELTYDGAAESFYARYRDYMDQALNGREDMPFICYGLVPCMNILTGFCDKASRETRDFYYGILNEDLRRFGRRTHKETQVDSLINQFLAELCIKSVGLCTDKEEKERLLFNLVIKRQLPTYIHTEMVTKISELIAAVAWEALPGYFEATGLKTKEALVAYTVHAAQLHDLGKIHSTDIVNMQRRPLDNEEFHGIRRHSELGARVVENDADLKEYADVIRGHHRFYDGTGGYPESFDNTKSKYRAVIDIVTLADCMDAATDRYSRNYKDAKTMEELLGEFEAEAGTRYNPELVKILRENTVLRAALEDIVLNGRLDLMYEACSEGKEKYI